MNERINWNNFTFLIESDDFERDDLNISVIDNSFDHGFPAFRLKLKPLWNRTGEGFLQGDYYQDTMNKETMVPVNKKLSYAALTHDFLLEHGAQIPIIKKIFSSSLNGHPDEAWTPSVPTRNFWQKQIEKGVAEILNGDRYYIIINRYE